jgi:hypothetical protein
MIADSFCASITDEKKKDEIRGQLAVESMNRSIIRSQMQGGSILNKELSKD